MYDVKITNNYFHTLAVNSPDANNAAFLVGKGETKTFKNWGSHPVFVPGMGAINFIDLADKKLDQYTNEHLPWTQAQWGGLIRYRGLDAYFRYEGQGQVEVELDTHGCVQLHFPKGGMIVNLPDMTVK